MSAHPWPRRVATAFAGLALAFSGAGCVTVWQGLTPQGPPTASESERRLRAGPWAVERRDLHLVDASRATPANGDASGAPTRTLETSIWLPADAPGARPLVIYSHGFMSQRREAAYLVEHLASHGYVVASADYPLSGRHAPGGPTLRDVGRQPGDVSFLIDSLLDRSRNPGPGEVSAALHGRVDPQRIAAVGLSLGGLTSTLVAFHPQLRDARVRAAVSIAGPVYLFTRRFFESARIPFLLIASTTDAVIDYPSNGARVLEHAPTASLVTLEGASHTGFAGISALVFRFWPNPDRFGCWYMRRGIDFDREGANPLEGLGGPRSGVVFPASAPPFCESSEWGRAMRPRRQHAITTLAVRAFLDRVLAERPALREAGRRYLAHSMADELDGVDYTADAVEAPRPSSP